MKLPDVAEDAFLVDEDAFIVDEDTFLLARDGFFMTQVLKTGKSSKVGGKSGKNGPNAGERSERRERMGWFSETVKKSLVPFTAFLTRKTRKDGNCGIPRIPCRCSGQTMPRAAALKKQ
ncbi:MAG: hypothetical protein FWC50_05355 [Planctomycetaceae bacterium]|nr:hypothetical protein [Planctomycetaceae bacterium]